MSYYRDEYGYLVDEDTGYNVKEYPSYDEYDDFEDDFFGLGSFGIHCADDMDDNCW